MKKQSHIRSHSVDVSREQPIQNRLPAALEYGKHWLSRLGLSQMDWTFRLDESRTLAGQCAVDAQWISISRHFAARVCRVQTRDVHAGFSRSVCTIDIDFSEYKENALMHEHIIHCNQCRVSHKLCRRWIRMIRRI